jgi:hypothetical protein
LRCFHGYKIGNTNFPLTLYGADYRMSISRPLLKYDWYL